MFARVAIVIAFFSLLALSAAFNLPHAVFEQPFPRGLKALDWIVTNLGTRPFGPLGGAAVFAALGAVVTMLVLKQSAPAITSSETTALAEPELAFARKRQFGQKASEAAGPGDRPVSTKGSLAKLLGAEPGSSKAEDQRPAGNEDYHRLIMGIIEANQPPPPREGPLDPAIDAARWRPIVFRQMIPPAGADSLSFYGGRPVVPAGFAWPRSPVPDRDKPLHFIMQCDCGALSQQDATGLLPSDGVLYFFLDFEWGVDDGFRFIHCPGPVEGWQPLEPPADLGPVHGDQGAWQMAGCASKVDNADHYVPRLMPRFAFDPLAFDYPRPAVEERDDDDDEQQRLFWNDSSACKEALLAVEDADRTPGPLKDISEPPPAFERPYAAFPQDFGAIRVLAAKAIDQLDSPYRLRQSRHVLPELSPEEREAQFDAWLDQAKELYLFASQRRMGEAVPGEVADQVWTWVVELEPVFRLGFHDVVTTSVDLSLGVGSDAIGTIPSEQVANAAKFHTLAREYLHDEYPTSSTTEDLKLHDEKRARGELKKVRSVHAPAPTRMFGPPSYVQGYVEELIDEHILLLEITSGRGPAHHFGDGVLQYLIRPDDLRVGRFEKVRAVISGY